MKEKILIVEDDKNICAFMSAVLDADGYDVITAATGTEAYSMITSHCPDLVLLDLGLPDIDGLSLIPAVREWTQMPIIVVSARTQENDKVEALDLGADDYIAKPFGTEELLARIRTALRHARRRGDGSGGMDTVYRCAELTVDFSRRRVQLAGEDVHLTQNEYRILDLLCRNAGRVLTYDFLLQELWGPAAKGSNQILRVNMANIRRKLEANPAEPRYIFTETGVGYRMADGE